MSLLGRRERKQAALLLNEVGRLGALKDDALMAVRARDAEIVHQRERVAALQSTLTLIQASLAEVAVYEGLPIGPDSVVLYVNELVRDHEELERRIDHAMLELRAAAASGVLLAEHVGKILQGGTPTPNGVDD